MEFLPPFRFGLLNGWLLPATFYLIFGLMLLVFPRQVVRRLYDLPKHTGRIKALWIIGRLIAFILIFGLLVALPLKIGEPVFALGIVVYLLGLSMITWALITYRYTPLDQPVVDGLYRVSRNPQALGLMFIILGACLAVGSWLAVLMWAGMSALYHIRIVGEERLCLEQYGDSYRAYMAQVPRYFLFFDLNDSQLGMGS
ncbi:MAG: hypothetical protein GTO14_13080 [Anaerolineales bacterium]|nr:hypothetical protein [Anaerolineales bacterium]